MTGSAVANISLFAHTDPRSRLLVVLTSRVDVATGIVVASNWLLLTRVAIAVVSGQAGAHVGLLLLAPFTIRVLVAVDFVVASLVLSFSVRVDVISDNGVISFAFHTVSILSGTISPGTRASLSVADRF